MEIFATGVLLLHYERWFLSIRVLVDMKAELGILIPVRIVLLVLFPKEITGDMGLSLSASSFAMYGSLS